MRTRLPSESTPTLPQKTYISRRGRSSRKLCPKNRVLAAQTASGSRRPGQRPTAASPRRRRRGRRHGKCIGPPGSVLKRKRDGRGPADRGAAGKCGRALSQRTTKKDRQAGGKPNSVHPKVCGHLSGRARCRAAQAANPGLLLRGPRQEPPIWPCSRWGLPCPACRHASGALLPHRFTLACGRRSDPSAV